MTIHNPILAIDTDEQTIIIAQFLGPPQAVKSNWAALMGGGKSHWINNTTIKLGGSKNHITLKKSLPCGWLEMWLIHHQASIEKMLIDEPFYVLDNETAVPPPNLLRQTQQISAHAHAPRLGQASLARRPITQSRHRYHPSVHMASAAGKPTQTKTPGRI